MENNISYNEYLELVKQEVSARTGKRVQLQKVTKNNGLELDGLTIISEDTNVSPTIYLNGYYNEFLTDGIEAVAKKVIAVYKENKPEISFDLSSIMDISRVKSFIKMKLINYEENKKLLVDTPHIKVLDLAVVFMIVLETEDECQFGTILIHNKFLDYWETEIDSLYKIAEENMRNDFETIPMENIIAAVMDESLVEECTTEMEFKMFVLTTYRKLHGAIGMLNKELLNAFMKRHKTEKLIILPSSTHEVLLLPYSDEMVKMDLYEMVREVNETVLEETEYLSNNVYLYNGKELKILE